MPPPLCSGVDPTTVAVLMEDGGALMGLAIAGGGGGEGRCLVSTLMEDGVDLMGLAIAGEL